MSVCLVFWWSCYNPVLNLRFNLDFTYGVFLCQERVLEATILTDRISHVRYTFQLSVHSTYYFAFPISPFFVRFCGCSNIETIQRASFLFLTPRYSVLIQLHVYVLVNSALIRTSSKLIYCEWIELPRLYVVNDWLTVSMQMTVCLTGIDAAKAREMN